MKREHGAKSIESASKTLYRVPTLVNRKLKSKQKLQRLHNYYQNLLFFKHTDGDEVDRRA